MAKTLKVATFNLEWMVSLFGARWKNWDGSIPRSFAGQTLGTVRLEPIADVPALCERIAGVIREVNADILCVQEGPPLTAQMARFVKDFLDDAYVVHTSNANWQTLHALVKRSIAGQVTAFAAAGEEVKSLRGKIPFYAWGEIKKQSLHAFDRVPLVLTFQPSDTKRLRLISVHTKSKFSKLKTPSQWRNRDEAAIRDALLARQKLSAEIQRLRQFISADLGATDLDANHRPDALLLLGDMNDGPYGELMEKEFMIHNIVDELVGSFLNPNQMLKHAMPPSVLKQASTVSFPDPLEGGAIVHELIDHMLVSAGLWKGAGKFKLRAGSCKVETAAYNRFDASTNADRSRGLRPSDHRPVSCVIEY